MTSTAHLTHLPGLEEPHQRAEAGSQLQALPVELVDLSLLGTVTRDSPLRGIDAGELEDHVAVREATRRLAAVAEPAREKMDRLGDLDAASQDVVIEVVRALERQLWMIRAQFAEGGVR
jgi:DNA-binding ferritin-like protein